MPPTSPRPLQDRSRRTADRITSAALELLGDRTFEEMTVLEIAARSGVSVGGIYARFAGKEGLLEALNSALFDRLVGGMREVLSPDATAGASAREVVHRYIAFAVTGFRAHRAVLRQVVLRSRASGDPAFRERVRAANRVLHDLLRQRLDERIGEIRHPEPRVAIDVALTAVSGAMREQVLFQEPSDGFVPLPDARLVEELTDLFCAYVRIEDEA